MIRRILFAVLALWCGLRANADVTLEQCVDNARDNYPLIRKYGLLQRTHSIALSDINKSWLPGIGIYGQGTMQNNVPTYPETLSEVLAQTGTEIAGLGKFQYKAGVDLNQTLWDGGTAKSQRAIENSSLAEQTSALDVQLYAIREQVENLFFNILLMEEQIKQAEYTHDLLKSNLDRLRSMNTNGTAMQSDVDMVEAQVLTVEQRIIQARSDAASFRQLLSLYTGTDLSAEPLSRPERIMPDALTSERPELTLFDARIKHNEAMSESIRTSLMPRIGLSAQLYYGYPGFDYFKSMTNRNMSFNILAGVKITWNIGAFYYRKNKESKLNLANEDIAADRDVFLFNTRLRAMSQTARIAELDEIIKDDARIIELRANVRKAAESQLRNGIIDATALLTKITDENQARLTAIYHEIQSLQTIYQLKYTLNR